jgi:dynein heavy chain
VAGSLLRAESGQDESDVLFRALRDFNIPKILAADMVIFMVGWCRFTLSDPR